MGVITEKFVQTLVKDISYELIEKINQKKSKDTIVLILSASPDIYIKKIGKHLGWEAVGSHFSDTGSFVHLWGNNKIDYLNIYYPLNDFEYSYSISDSIKDLALLKIFKEYELV